MRDSLLTQAALLAALDGEIGAPVYDEVAATVPVVAADGTQSYAKIQPPFVVLGETTSSPVDTHDGFGSLETAMLHIWSRAPGMSECKAIMGAIDELLHQRTLVLEGGRSVRTTLEFSEVMTEETEPGERWRHGVMRIRIRTLDLAPLEDAYYG